MYAHQVIEDIKEWLSEINKKKNIFMYKKDYNQIATIHKIAIDLLISSQCFYFDNIATDILLDMKASDNDPILQTPKGYINLPYNPLWLEFNTNNLKLGTLLAQYKNTDRSPRNEYDLFCFVYRNGIWEIVPKVASILDGTIENVDTSTYGPRNKLDNEILSFAFLAHVALLLLNCKNIQTEKIKAPEALNKKRRKQGKQPIFDYHVLNVVVPSAKRGYQGKTEPLSHNRVHLCRGHFKEYTEEHPLFGKYTGLYWWQPHVRGQNKDGIVMKDYEVKTK